MAGVLRGVPAVMGDGTRRAYRRVEQGRGLFPRLALVLLCFADRCRDGVRVGRDDGETLEPGFFW